MSANALFGTLAVARSGMGVYKTWLNAVADNVANMNNVARTEDAAFQERFVIVQPIEDGDGTGAGAQVVRADFGDPAGRLEYNPNHPLADEQGLVRLPDIDLSDQMVFMQLAQRGYQANVTTHERAREAYEAALSIGSR